MIRRWSFITTLKTPSSRYNVFKHFLFEENINNVMYLRKVYPSATTLFRRPWARRKHISNWLVGSSVLKLWSQNYRFFKNMNKFLQNVFLASNSCLIFGGNFKQKKVLEFLKASPNLNASFLNKTFFNGSKITHNFFKSHLAYYKSISPLFISWKYPTDANSFAHFHNLMGFFSHIDTSLWLYPSLYTRVTVTLHYVSLFSLIFRLWLLNFKLLYQSLVLIVLPLLS